MTALRFQTGGRHQTSLVSLQGEKASLLIDFLEDVLETAIIALQDGVLGAHVQRPALHQGILETGVSEPCDGLAKAVRTLI